MVAHAKLDPIAFEVLRHKLDEIVAEAYHTIGRVSGSPVVYESGDHQEAICTGDGRLAAFGAGVLQWVRSISSGVAHVATAYADNPGFSDGDQFLVNDSYHAAVHASDVQVLAPIFWEDELIAWVGSASHQVDTGGVNPGGHHVSATDVYAEGFQTRGLKLVEAGRMRKDVEDTFANMVRQPSLGLLDIRAKIASNNVMKERLLELVERYGVDTVLALFEQLMVYSEGRLRAKLAQLPDGAWSASNSLEGIAEPHLDVTVTLRKRGDGLTFDYTGTSPQSKGPENIGVPGAVSCTMDPLITMLCHDIPWNEGLFTPVDFVLPEGSLVNPRHPAPVSSNIPSGANILVITCSQRAIAKMLLGSETFRQEACANTGGAFNFPVLAGPHRDGSEFTTLLLDGLAGGTGGLVDADGDNSGHNSWAVKNMIANVETNEMMYPLLYLWRGEVGDSAGAGKQRGGVGVSEALVPWDTSDLVLVTVGAGAEARSCQGLAGGYPASNTPICVHRGADVANRARVHGKVASSVDELGGVRESISAKGVTTLGVGDALFAQVSAGGGGYGDPLHRDPEEVRRDVELGYVSAAMAAEVYGVVIDSDTGRVANPATEEARQSIRRARLEKGTRHA